MSTSTLARTPGTTAGTDRPMTDHERRRLADLVDVATTRSEAGWTTDQLLTWLRSPVTHKLYGRDNAAALALLIGGEA